MFDRGFPALAGMDPARPCAGCGPSGLPRARGDGPDGDSGDDEDDGASPRSRGWTVQRMTEAVLGAGFPALAGMDPPPHPRSPGRRGLPRARGDGPVPILIATAADVASPRSRGWTPGRVGYRVHLRGFPALAGMDPRPLPARRPAEGLPRARGDGPRVLAAASRDWVASPRSRGWTRAMPHPDRHARGFPALAGMDPGTDVTRRRRAGLPRARGDGPASRTSSPREPPASPRSRGWTRPGGRLGDAGPGFPALAGMDPPPCAAMRLTAWLPRARGDGPPGFVDGFRPGPASPRSRGWTQRNVDLDSCGAGFPALAGMDLYWYGCPRLASGLPRARGDGPVQQAIVRRGIEASPRSRGWTRQRGVVGGGRPGFPALAGMDPEGDQDVGRPGGLPRARGDGPSPPTYTSD